MFRELRSIFPNLEGARTNTSKEQHVLTYYILNYRLEFGSFSPAIFCPALGPYFCHILQCNKYVFLAKREIKMAGYWPRFVFACLQTETRSIGIKGGDC